MPIKIDLLAEAREAEELRTRNPVKRAIWIASFFVGLVLIWMLKIGLDIYFAKIDCDGVEQRSQEMFVQFAAGTNDLLKIADIDQKLNALDRLASNRFLWAPLLSALQTTTVSDVQVTRLAGSQTYSLEKSVTIGSGSGKMPASESVIERITLSIESKDTSTNRQAWSVYKQALGNCDYFVRNLKRGDGFVLDGLLHIKPASESEGFGQFSKFVLVSQFQEVRRGE
jgi:hypothetical protein